MMNESIIELGEDSQPQPQPQPQPEKPSSATPVTTTGSTSSPHSKPCTLCQQPRNVLIRCQIDATRQWHFVCPGKCWRSVSGGTPDGDADHRDYRYGGTWKNKHEYVSAKIKGKAKDENKTGFKSREHRRPAWKERLYKSEKDLPGVKGKAGVVEGVRDGEIGDEEFDFGSDFEDDEGEDGGKRFERDEDFSHVQVKRVDK